MHKRAACASLVGLPSGSVLRSHEGGSGGVPALAHGEVHDPQLGVGGGMELSWVHANAGEYDTSFSCPEHIF
jgi:hypothetical protein